MDISASPLSAAASPAMNQANYANVLAQKAIQQITEPVPAVLPGTPGSVGAAASAVSPAIQGVEPTMITHTIPTAPPPEPMSTATAVAPPQPVPPAGVAAAAAEPVNFVQEIQSMLYSFGDSRRPRLETAILVDDIVRQQLVEILLRATDASHLRGGNGVVGIEEVLFLLRKNPVKVQRFVKYFKVKDLALASIQQNNGAAAPLENKRAKRCRDFLLSIDVEGGGVLTQALNEEIHDEVRWNRLKRRDRYTRILDERKYAEFTRARHISFLGHNMRFAAKFREWVVTGIKATPTDDANSNSSSSASQSNGIKMDRSGLEALAYLAYETVGYIVEMALLVRHDADPDTKADAVQRAMVPVAYNTQYPMVQMPISSAEDNARRMLNNRKEEDSIFTQPLEPHHVLEAVRRLSQRPSSSLGWHRRLEPRNRPNPMPIIAI